MHDKAEQNACDKANQDVHHQAEKDTCDKAEQDACNKAKKDVHDKAEQDARDKADQDTCDQADKDMCDKVEKDACKKAEKKKSNGKGGCKCKADIVKADNATPTSLPHQSPRRAKADHQQPSLISHPMLLPALSAVFVLGKEKTQTIISWLLESTRVNSGLVCYYQLTIFQDY